MKQELRAMIGLLNQLRKIQEELLALSAEKKQIIIACDTERLGDIVKRELALMSGINAVEKQRAPLVAALSKELGVPQSGLTLRALGDLAPDGERAELLRLHRELSDLMGRQTEFNRLNQNLLQTQLEYTDQMLGVMVGSEDPLNNFYGDDGKTDPEKRKSAGLFDWQA